MSHHDNLGSHPEREGQPLEDSKERWHGSDDILH